MKHDHRRKRGSRPSPCSICGRTFDRKDTLQRHVKIHLEDSEGGHRSTKTIRKRFQACIECQVARTRCTGTSPCLRCGTKGKECLYRSSSPNQRSITMSFSPVGSSTQSELISASPTDQISHNPLEHNNPAVTAKPIAHQAEITEVLAENEDTHSLHPVISHSSVLQHSNASPNHVYISDFDTRIQIESPQQDQYPYKSVSISDAGGPAETQPLTTHNVIRYPVLEALEPFLDPNFSLDLACNLLDSYFSSKLKSRLHPAGHYIHTFILRRCDVLDPDRPRRTHPALLASMLWVATLGDSALGHFTSLRNKEQACTYLSLLCFRLLDPAVHGAQLIPQDMGLPPVANLPRSWSSNEIWQILQSKGFGPSLPYNWALDYTMAFIHLGSVISASEKKADSIRWWKTAFTLANDLSLYEEIRYEDSNGNISPISCGCTSVFSNDRLPTEVQREERRRTWWLLFLMDRHLALCYNRPLALSESQSQNLLLPMNEIVWQSGVLPHSHGYNSIGPKCFSSAKIIPRHQGAPLRCTGDSLFDFFLPLMTITGHLLELNRSKNHPLLGMINTLGHYNRDLELQKELDVYQESLNATSYTINTGGPQGQRTGYDTINSPFESLTRTPPYSPSGSQQSDLHLSENSWFSKTALLYAKYILLVLRVLLSNKWDPACLFEDADFWTSSPSFRDSMSHTMTATEVVRDILLEDPDISFMPYFFGIQLLHGSLLLLLVVYRLQSDSGTAILKACETAITATEACYVTLPTDYQRQFRNLMRSALRLAKGWKYDSSDTERQLKTVLARYRWSRNGGGLARE